MYNQAVFYFSFFLIAAVFSAIFVFLAKKISLKYNFYDDPNNDPLKIHKNPVPFLGGAAILCSVLFCLLLLWFLKKIYNLNVDNLKIGSIFIGSIIAWFYGFWDDTYWQDRKKITQVAKIFLQIPIAFSLAIIFFIVQIKYQFFGLSLIGIFMVTFVFLFIENAVNLQDGLDGLAPSVTFISSLAFFVFFILSQNIFAAVLSIIIAGGLFAFLFFNWKPASIFLGNNGSYFLGFLMAIMVIMASVPGRFFYSLVPYFLIGAPIFNVCYVFLKRIVVKKNLFSADRNHLHHDLLKITKSVPKSVFIICGIHLIFIVIGMLLLVKFMIK